MTMRARFAVPLAILILAAGWWVSVDPQRLGPLFEYLDDQVSQPDLSAPIVELQPDERWLVVVVDFPNAPETSFRNVERAETILSGTNGADDYIDQMSGGSSSLQADVLADIYHASHDDSHWGADVDEVRDSGQAGSDGPAGLAEAIIRNALTGIDLSPYDLNQDGWVDRFLIIHTAEAQEDAGGSSRIWSHFGPLIQTVEVGEYKFDHYTITGFDSGLGTMVHEMLHQMGALDLYDVHGLGTGEEWNGLGDWDIMASGNWNGVNGRTPALPSMATLQLIGAERGVEVSVASTTPQSQEYVLEPLSGGGLGLFIEISPSERVWMAYRGDVGFDKELPGAGLLVTIQDSLAGDPSQNLVNTNSEIPWLYVLEADGNGGLLNGQNEGEAGDVFDVGDKFGAEGRPILDHYGRKVHWTIEVTARDATSLSIEISSDGAPMFDVLPPHQPIQLLADEPLDLLWSASSDCSPTINLVSNDGRNVSMADTSTLSAGTTSTRALTWDAIGSAPTEGRLVGTVQCGDDEINVDIEFHVIGQRLITTTFAADVHYQQTSNVTIPIEFEGSGTTQWEVRVEGPLERIATTDSTQSLGDGSEIILIIDPSGLLSPGMLASGEVVLRDADGLEQRVNVTLTAEQFEQGGEIVRFFSNPSNIILVVAGMLALSVLLGISRRGSGKARMKAKARDKAVKQVVQQAESSDSQPYRPVGRPSRPSGLPTTYTQTVGYYDPNEIPDIDDELV